MGKGSHDPKADEPSKLAGRTLTMKRSASRDLLGDALDCAASCIDAAALDAYRLDYASFRNGVPLSGHFSNAVLWRPHAVDASPAYYGARRATEKTNKRLHHTGIDWERCAARRESSRRPPTTRPP